MSSDDGTNRRRILDETTAGNVSSPPASRRGFVAAAAATVGALLGVSGTAGARSAPSDLPRSVRRAAVEPYRSEAAVRDALGDHEDLLAEAAEAGFLATDSAAEVDLNGLEAPAAGDSFDGVKFTAKAVDGEITPEFVLVRERDDEVLNVIVFPERSEALSTVNSPGDVSGQHHGYDCPGNSTCCGCCGQEDCHICCVCC